MKNIKLVYRMANIIDGLILDIDETRQYNKILKNILFMFIIVSYSIIIITTNTTNYDETNGTYGSASIVLWAYSIICFSLIIMIFRGNLATNDNLIQILLFFFILFWAISINFNFFKIINSNKIPSEYTTYSFITNILLMVHTITIIYKDIIDHYIRSYNIIILGSLIILSIFSLTIQQLMLDKYYIDVL
tara:strand:- start:2049 stop:2618 length:570 start_codon:yes stop_codon:yes gene_type:complete